MNFEVLNLIYRCSKESNHGKIKSMGLSDTEYMICSYVYSHENCSQDDVASTMKIDKTTVGKALLTLEEKKCVKRTANESDKGSCLIESASKLIFRSRFLLSYFGIPI